MVMYWYDSEIHIILNMLKNMAANVHFFINVYKYLSMKSLNIYLSSICFAFEKRIHNVKCLVILPDDSEEQVF